ncbi:MAG: tetratricopeptide repeat protein [Saprospiraceae bacterium]
MDSENTQKLIERYFENDLSGQELEAFEQRLSDDPRFAEAFQLEKDLLAGIEAFGNEQLRAQLEAMHVEETMKIGPTNGQVIEEPGYTTPFDPKPVDGKVVKMVGRRWWLAAAVLAIGLLARWFFAENKPTTDQLYAIFAQHEFDFTEMGANDELLPRAEQLLKNQKYAEALPLLETYLSTHPDDVEVKLAKGKSLLELGRFKEALEVFSAIAQNNPVLADEANWCQALTYLKQGDVENCKRSLENVSASSVRKKYVNKLLRYLE